MTGLEQFHQGKGNDKANRSPLQASQSQVEHSGQMVAQASATLKGRRRNRVQGRSLPFSLSAEDDAHSG